MTNPVMSRCNCGSNVPEAPSRVKCKKVTRLETTTHRLAQPPNRGMLLGVFPLKEDLLPRAGSLLPPALSGSSPSFFWSWASART